MITPAGLNWEEYQDSRKPLSLRFLQPDGALRRRQVNVITGTYGEMTRLLPIER
jgi:hypothetical protein